MSDHHQRGKNMRSTLFLSAVLFFFLSISASADDMPATVSIKSLSTHIANKIVVATVKDCTNRGYKVAAAVVGRDGNLLAFLRNPLAGAHTIKTSQIKAYTSSSLQVSTSELKENEDLKFAPGLLLLQGGVPISVGGTFYGAVAVSGAEPKIDEECAETGIKAVEEILEFSD